MTKAATGSEVATTFETYGLSVDAVAWSPDGTYIAASLEDTSDTGDLGTPVQVWKAANGGEVYSYQGHHRQTVLAIDWSPDSQHIASGSADTTVQVWKATDGTHPSTYRGHSYNVSAVAWSPDGQRIASGSGDGTVQVWEPK